tara:strand:- start:2126 stop:2233 length:108 start_codon:yes stop_codon:yes gene_type:complete
MADIYLPCSISHAGFAAIMHWAVNKNHADFLTFAN